MIDAHCWIFAEELKNLIIIIIIIII